MKISKMTAIALTAFTQASFAADCTVDAEFLHSYPANEIPSKFKFKFKVVSDDCVKGGCEGLISYRIHFQYKDGDSNSKSSVVSYRIPDGQKSREVTDETYPSGSSTKISIRDVEIGNVSCRTR